MSIAGVAGGISAFKNPTTLRYTIAAPNVDETIVLPPGTRSFTIQNVGIRFIYLAYDAGDIGAGNYFTLAPYAPHQSPGTIAANASYTLYVRSPGLETLEIDIWR